MKLLKEVLKNNIKYLIPLLVFTMVSIYFRLENTSYIGTVVNDVMRLVSENQPSEVVNSTLMDVALKMLGICALISIAGLLSSLFASKISAAAGKYLRKKLFSKVMSFSMPEIDRFSVSELITRSTIDIVQIQNVLFIVFTTALQVPFMMVGGIGSMIASKSGLSWTIALASGLVVLILVIVVFLIFKVVTDYQKKIDAINTVTREALTGIQVIRAFNRDEWNENRIKTASGEFRDVNISFTRRMLIMEPSVYFILNIINVLAIYIGSKRVEDGSLSVGIISAYTGYLYMIVVGVLMFGISIFSIIRMFVSLKRINEIVSVEPSITDGGVDIDSIDKKLSVEFKDVSFKYKEDGNYVVRDIDFVAENGKTTAIIGNTGCGKSTLMNLIPRLYDAAEGEILIGGVNVKDLKVQELRDSIGYVTQKAVLFTGDIENNVEFGSKAEAKEVEEAIRIAQMEEFVEENEKGLNYEIARGGSNVSGGQRQRLSIARALARNPKIYLFDDSFSALDYKTDAILRHELKSKTKDATVIIVAQRVSTVMDADQIIVMHDGEIVGKGNSSELFKSCEYYREIVKSQVSENEYERLLKENE
ncbi:MAG: ABC transporter ATP-binding protein/permease [Lachnospiraceae bacterium]|nr:ABC transporter ATP-binding protein/permease [Lachnospiraceae bacterium]